MNAHPEPLAQRLAHKRNERGLTQEALAVRLAVSRVAVSHFELGLTVPSERTIVLLAGVFNCEPHELVADTNYPVAKALRLPDVACRHTELALQVALLRRDIQWLHHAPARATHVYAEWCAVFTAFAATVTDPAERALLDEAWMLLEQVGGSKRDA